MTNQTRANLIGLGIGVLLFLIALPFIIHQENARAKALTRWALVKGLHFVPGGKIVALGPVPSMRFFRMGPPYHFKEEVIKGEIDGMEFQSFDCLWGWTGRVSPGGTYTDTVELFFPVKNLPDFELYPQQVPGYAYEPPSEPGAEHVGGVFVSPSFHCNYMLVAEESSRLRQRLAVTLRHFVEGRGGNILWWIQAKGGWLFLCNYTGRLPTSRMEAFFQDGLALTRELPAAESRASE